MTIGEIFRQTYINLKDAQVDQPHLEAGWIIEKYAHIDSAERIKNADKEIETTAIQFIEEAIARRKTGEPLAYIFEECEFYSYPFYVNKNVLIPRPETEQLVDWALKWVESNKAQKQIEILDLGTGSGCLGLTLIKEIPTARLTAVDISKEALSVARRNAELLKVSNRVEFINLDAARAEHLMNQFDLIVANPPYIAKEDATVELNVRKFEPNMALFSKDNGLFDIQSWLKASSSLLKEKSAIGFEIGSQQGEPVLKLFRDLNIFSQQYGLKDYAGHARFVCGEIN
ncbi:MAG: peptide chain release factor N(5)-glutamine methyltransferase [Bdellovibrionales bacterium]|nr:peptide chain release factor N(5)-glutamine methyltransferase [Bdellovibrionales bacterium]